MKKIDIIKLLLLLLPAALLVAGCSKEEEKGPFTGNENYIAVFTLAKDGVTLKGAVSPNAIVITAPERFSLSGATASVTISENATITPDPTTITEWDTEQTFTITSYNGRKNTYNYSVERYLVSRSGDVVLLTQADVDAFVEEIKDADQINGSLTIGAATGQDSVYSLAGLEQLKIITGGITVNATYAGEELSDFEKLETTNELHIASKKLKTVHFPKLASIRADLNIDGANAISTLEFPELTTVDKGLRIYRVDSLASISFPKLQQIIENLTLAGDYYGTPKTQYVDLPELTKIGGNFTVSYMNKIENFNLPKLETVGGTLSPATEALTTLQLPALKSTGSLEISNLAVNLTTMRFPALKFIKKDLNINLQSLTTLDAFSAVDSIGGLLYLFFLPELTSLEGLSSLKSVQKIQTISTDKLMKIDVRGIKVGVLDVYSPEILGDDEFPGELLLSISSSTAVTGFRKVGKATLNTADGNVDIPWLEEVAGLLDLRGTSTQKLSLPNLRSAGGVSLGYLYALTTLDLPVLEIITGYTSGTTVAGDFSFYMANYCALSSFTLPKLKSITGNLSITYIPSNVTTISFPALESITGILTLEAPSYSVNNNLTDLSGFSNLTSANGVTISYFKQLKDFEPLKNVLPSLDAVVWKITNCGYNPSYKDMLDGKYSN